jgi:hypothetical protein
MFSAFQHKSFQNNAYQINSDKADIVYGGGGFSHGYYERIIKYRSEQARIQQEIVKAEQRAKDEKDAKERLEKQIQQEKDLIRRKELELQLLREQQQLLYMDILIEELKKKLLLLRIEEEDILVILYSLPFMS